MPFYAGTFFAFLKVDPFKKEINMKKKALHKISKKMSKPNVESGGGAHITLKDQYEVIKQDLLKLRHDLSKGYDLVRDLVDRRVTK